MFEPRRFFADGDMVAVLSHYTLRVIKKGTVIDNDWVHAFTLRGGKIADFEGFEDSAKSGASLTAARLFFLRRRRSPRRATG